MQQALKTSLVAEINFKYAEARAYAEKAENLSLDALNGLREVGILLEDAKSNAGYQWPLIQAQLDFGERQMQMCLMFARKHPEKVTCTTRAIRMLDDIRMTTGLLPFSEGHGPQQLHQPSFGSVISKQFTSFRAEWKKQLTRSPLNVWDRPTLEQFVCQIQPVVDELTSIYAKAKAQLEQAIAGPS